MRFHAADVAPTDNISLGKAAELTRRSQNQSHGSVRALPTTGSAGIWILCLINDRRPTTTKVDMSEVTGGIVDGDHQS